MRRSDCSALIKARTVWLLPIMPVIPCGNRENTSPVPGATMLDRIPVSTEPRRPKVRAKKIDGPLRDLVVNAERLIVIQLHLGDQHVHHHLARHRVQFFKNVFYVLKFLRRTVNNQRIRSRIGDDAQLFFRFRSRRCGSRRARPRLPRRGRVRELAAGA